tara:strand:+ start:1195 stop:1422 length:228 start_codon:yes stop_codon:yes gene_type:complete
MSTLMSADWSPVNSDVVLTEWIIEAAVIFSQGGETHLAKENFKKTSSNVNPPLVYTASRGALAALDRKMVRPDPR